MHWRLVFWNHRSCSAISCGITEYLRVFDLRDFDIEHKSTQLGLKCESHCFECSQILLAGWVKKETLLHTGSGVMMRLHVRWLVTNARLAAHILPRTTVWVSSDRKLLWDTAGEQCRNIHSHEKKATVSITTQRQLKGVKQSSSKRAERRTLNQLDVCSLWVSPLWGAQHTTHIPSESEQSAAVHHLKARGQSSTGPQTCDQLSHTTPVTVRRLTRTETSTAEALRFRFPPAD